MADDVTGPAIHPSPALSDPPLGRIYVTGPHALNRRNNLVIWSPPVDDKHARPCAHSSPDGDSGYPGKLDTTVTYVLDENGALTISFDAKTSKPTIVNPTNHAIFNLEGEGSPEGALGHLLTIPAKCYTPVDAIARSTRDRLGEGVLWSARDNSVYCVDILAPALNRLLLTDGRVERWPMPEPLGWVAERAQGGFIAGFQSGFARLTLNPSASR